MAVQLSGTDLTVSPICLGTVALGCVLDQKDSFALLDAFVDLGGNFLDTAGVYSDWYPGVESGCSEKTIGRWLVKRGAAGRQIVVATKIGHPDLDRPEISRLSGDLLRADVQRSLSRLGVEALGLVYLHRDDPSIPAVDIIGALESLRREGLIRYYGASNWTTQRIELAMAAAEQQGWLGFSANQPCWSIATVNQASMPAGQVALDTEMFEMHVRRRLAAIPYWAQARGYFDTASSGTLDSDRARTHDNPANRQLDERLQNLSAELDLPPTAVAIAVLMRSPFPTVPVVGCSTTSHLRSSFAAAGASLSDEMMAALRVPGLPS